MVRRCYELGRDSWRWRGAVPAPCAIGTYPSPLTHLVPCDSNSWAGARILVDERQTRVLDLDRMQSLGTLRPRMSLKTKRSSQEVTLPSIVYLSNPTYICTTPRSLPKPRFFTLRNNSRSCVPAFGSHKCLISLFPIDHIKTRTKKNAPEPNAMTPFYEGYESFC